MPKSPTVFRSVGQKNFSMISLREQVRLAMPFAYRFLEEGIEAARAIGIALGLMLRPETFGSLTDGTR